MVVRSAMVRDGHVTPIEIELVLAPGLPVIEFLGRPEPSLKESAVRIKSALRASGHALPKGRKVLVDLRPRLERKHGIGLDLPVALGLMALLGRIPHEMIRDHVIYGDLSLRGDVLTPEDWKWVSRKHLGRLLTGTVNEGIEELSELSSLRFPLELKARGSSRDVPSQNRCRGLDTDLDCDSVRLEEATARLAVAVAVGEHSMLMAGPAGTGKTTLTKIVHELRPDPSPSERLEIERWAERDCRRPYVSEHHLTKELAMVGGGQPPRPGAVTRAHLGTLTLDEALLFRPQVQDALREPTEAGVINLARGPYSERFPCRYLLLGTTNLCACGSYTDERPELCICSRAVRRQYAARRRGPFVDRFQMLVFSTNWKPGLAKIDFRELERRVERAEEFRLSRLFIEGGPAERNAHRVSTKVAETWAAGLPQTLSERRRQAVLKLARTLADLDGTLAVTAEQLSEAKSYALDPFLQWSGGNA
ncbi:MAG: ATP-binding protein [Bdellovibrionaceae bacterium]|nr:ATP-binding protein [Pseudobdellovibrionaceae bacterium]